MPVLQAFSQTEVLFPFDVLLVINPPVNSSFLSLASSDRAYIA